MHRNNAHHRVRRPHRGQALLIALGLVLALGILVMATQFLTITHLSSSKAARYNERAILVAEQGVNQILYTLAQGGSAPSVITSPPTIAAFAAGVTNHTYTLTRYPTTSTTEGYYACVPTALSGTGGPMYVYGWSHGVVRRVRVILTPYSIFNWAAAFAVNPGLTGGATNYSGQWDTSGSNYAFTFAGNASVNGAFASEGRLDNTGSANFVTGPGRMAGPNARFGNVSAPNTGTPPTPVADPAPASPFARFYPNTIYMLTADMTANQWIQYSQGVSSPSPAGVAYYRSTNNNATGLRYVVWNGVSYATVRELGPLLNAQGQVVANYTVPVTVNGATALTNASWTAPSNLSSTSDLKAGEQVLGIRVYPGDYYFDYVNFSNGLFLRSYADTEYAKLKSQLAISLTYNANPNTRAVNGISTQLSGESNIRFWVGGSSASTFSPASLEYSHYSSRFRIYDADSAGLGLTISGGSSASPFQANLLCYNNYANGNGHGLITVAANAYISGSLIGWQVNLGSNSTVLQQTPEVGPGDLTVYDVTAWSELL